MSICLGSVFLVVDLNMFNKKKPTLTLKISLIP